MWPWEHLAVGYVLFALLARVFDWTLDDVAVLALAVGTQFPDLVDKPLAWGFAALPSGTSLAHSVFVAVPVALAVWLTLARLSHGVVGVGFAVGYLAHLPADILYGPLTRGGPVSVDPLLWPLVEQTVSNGGGLLATVAYYLAAYQAFLTTPRVVGYLVFELLLLGVALWLWVADGTPGLGLVRRRPGPEREH